MRFFLRFLFTTLIIYFLIQFHYLSGVVLDDSATSLLIFTFILGLINLIVGGVLRLITFPLQFLTLGIIGFLISLVVVFLADEFVYGVTLIGWMPLIIIALIMGIVSSILA